VTLEHASSRRPIHVLAVDDSALVRQVLSAILSPDFGFEVATAHDPIFALEKMRRQRPDVVILDLEMPRMDGLTFLRKIMADDPLPVIVCSALTGRGTDTALRAIEEGAVEVVAKPRVGVKEFLTESAVMFVDTVRAAAHAKTARRRQRSRARTPGSPPRAEASTPKLTVTTDKVVAIGASTGGTEALRFILEELPPDAPGLVVVQHMPEGFTRAFAERLNQTCAIEVKEAASGDRILDGRALIARGDHHLVVSRSGAHYVVDLTRDPLVRRHRPSVDVLFQSVARATGPNAVGVIMTGMGDDGANGLLEMKRAGAATIAQDEASCVVFGMPKEAIARGGVDDIVPLERIPDTLLRRARHL
jgi:two-component system, chemotaxis family, protein-glutamate methylesterase/glutaminase